MGFLANLFGKKNHNTPVEETALPQEQESETLADAPVEESAEEILEDSAEEILEDSAE
jgi:hypothetical protein